MALIVERPLLRLDAPAKLTGQATYVADVSWPRMAHARLVLSPHPHARIRAIHAEEAYRLPGILGVFSAQELGEAGILADGETLYAGQPVAVVVAESAAAAEDGAERVTVEYEGLPAVTDLSSARRPGAPAVARRRPGGREGAAAHGAAASGRADTDLGPNVGQVVRFQAGDVEAGWQQADLVLADTYWIPAAHQGYLETHGSLAQFRADRAEVYTSTQGQFFVRDFTASVLGWPQGQVRVVPCEVGGGFGGKIALVEPLVAVLARRLGRPVRLVLDRLQDFLLSHPAPAARITLKMGAARDGRLTALEATLEFDAGAEPESAPVGIAALLLAGTYRVPAYSVTAIEVLTHKAPVGAYRAPGAAQAYFALESHMDRLARGLALDPIEFRLRNAAREGDLRPDGQRWPRTGLVECLERVRAHPFWRDRQKRPGVGYGVAVGGWLGGIEPAAAACRINTDGSLTVTVGAVDITGTHTTMALIAARVLNQDPQAVRVVLADTDSAPYAGISGGSKVTYTVGKAVEEAAGDLKRQILELAAQRLEAHPDDLVLEPGQVRVAGVPGRAVRLAELAALSMQFGGHHAPLYGTARTVVDRQSPGFAVHVARVAVDPDTGAVAVTGYLACQDVGHALNPPEVAGQIEGAVAQGIGRALLERLSFADGQPLTTTLAEYLLPTSAEVPDVLVELVEVPSPYGPFGAKGVGEPPAVPGPAAIANAVEDAGGGRITALPITGERVLRARGQSAVPGA